MYVCYQYSIKKKKKRKKKRRKNMLSQLLKQLTMSCVIKNNVNGVLM